jgi:hypothetical protein
MTSPFEVTSSPTFRDMEGRFTKASDELLEARRDELRQLGQKFVQVMRSEAPAGKTGAFRRSIVFRTFESGDELSMRTYSAQPLGTWIVEGTRRHPITATNARALYFFWPKVGMFTVVPKRGGFKTHVSGGKYIVGKGYVDHPGTKANDYVSRAYYRLEDDIDQSLKRISTRFVKVLNGEAI